MTDGVYLLDFDQRQLSVGLGLFGWQDTIECLQAMVQHGPTSSTEKAEDAALGGPRLEAKHLLTGANAATDEAWSCFAPTLRDQHP